MLGASDTLFHVLGVGDPQAPALAVADGPRYTREQLHAAITDVAARLTASGIKPGDVVSMAIANTVDFVVSFLAVTYARAVAAPLNPAYTKEENHFYLEDSKAVLLLVPQEGNAAAQAAAQQLQVPIASLSVQPQGGSPPQVLLQPLPGSRLTFLPPGARALAAPPQPSDIALFLHTSGTTGRPKGVPLSHANLMSSLANIRATYELCAQDVSYLVMPLFHVHGLMAGLLSPLSARGSVVLPAGGRFSAAHFWSDCCKYGATYYTAVPTIHQVLLARAAKDYPASAKPPLRFIRSCSSALAPATLEKLEATFKVPVLEAYAMTEASHQMCSNPLPKHGPRKPGTVGPAQGGVRVAILDAQNRVLGQNQIGEVCIRGPNVMAGYLNNPNANKEAFAGGWFHTGDQGFLDADGYVTLTGRIKELINRGGEKISPLEVDAALLSHPAVAEAVSFGAPDEKYGEVVAAAVVLKPGASREGVEASIQQHCGKALSAFKVPTMVFITDTLPKTATGKIQRRHMVAAFIKPGGAPAGGAAGGKAGATPAAPAAAVPGLGDGYELVARSLAAMGVKLAFGVVGIPVTPLASSLQAAGIRFFGMRNEQAAGYAAAAAGFLTGQPAVLLTVSGPGAVHGIAGASHATVNCFPLLMLAGSAEQDEVGKGAFQELDQVAALAPYCKLSERADSLQAIPDLLARAVHAATQGRPGAVYVDLPSSVLLARLPGGSQAAAQHVPKPLPSPDPCSADAGALSQAAQLLQGASRPLVVVGKGAALARADAQVQHLANRFGLPVLCTSMGRGLLPDSHPLCANAARSAALKGADVALVVGARLNWQLHFGEAPRWAQGVRFILLDVEPSPRDAAMAAVVLRCDARAGLSHLSEALARQLAASSGSGAAGLPHLQPWRQHLAAISHTATAKLSKRLAAPPPPHMDYYAALGAVRQVLAGVQPAPVVVSEGANTMDMARLLLPASAARTRLDAGTWGTMGVGLGYAVAAAATAQPGQVVVAVEGDSAFGFSGMELEVMQRYKLPIVVLVMNNGGIYGGDRRESGLAAAAAAGAAAAGFGADPAPTAFVPDTRYGMLMEAFGGTGVRVSTPQEVQQALRSAIQRALEGQPAVLDVVLDPLAGSESGSVHAFNVSASSKL